ncbi:hypothetical protein FHS01_005667 [Longimicrobium terrae]|uniref:Uncharacterized protein n=1 Tax=Longimicrobium terrae TaxID=1639882 RepID=A0A841H7S6_9BACT|nr:hypothetical protein [Longimicrobium terrae]MBB6073952.1 hypothetical protein [Longimicrobium terrae]
MMPGARADHLIASFQRDSAAHVRSRHDADDPPDSRTAALRRLLPTRSGRSIRLPSRHLLRLHLPTFRHRSTCAPHQARRRSPRRRISCFSSGEFIRSWKAAARSPSKLRPTFPTVRAGGLRAVVAATSVAPAPPPSPPAPRPPSPKQCGWPRHERGHRHRPPSPLSFCSAGIAPNAALPADGDPQPSAGSFLCPPRAVVHPADERRSAQERRSADERRSSIR